MSRKTKSEEIKVEKPKKTCMRCGKELGQTDMTQTDANGGKWHCECADIALVEWVNMSAKIEQLKEDFVAMSIEKERCRKLAVDYSLMADSYKASLERCENMKLAHEFEDLLGTTSIPIAVEKLKVLIKANKEEG